MISESWSVVNWSRTCSVRKGTEEKRPLQQEDPFNGVSPPIWVGVVEEHVLSFLIYILFMVWVIDQIKLSLLVSFHLVDCPTR